MSNIRNNLIGRASNYIFTLDFTYKLLAKNLDDKVAKDTIAAIEKLIKEIRGLLRSTPSIPNLLSSSLIIYRKSI